MNDRVTYRQAKASVFFSRDDSAFIVTQTPSEAVEIITSAELNGEVFAQLSLGNRDEWNGKPLFVRATAVVAVSAPKSEPADEDDDRSD